MEPAQPQKWPDLLVIVRHGQSERNVAKDRAKASGAAEVWGSSLRDVDTPLTPLGVQQAVATGQSLRDQANFDVLFSSPYMRTLQTSQHILEQLTTGPRLILEERIREIEFGTLDGLTHDGIRERYPDESVRREREGKYWYRPPGGESRPDVALRVHSFLGTLTRDYRQKNVLVVCHSVVVLIFRRLLERWDEAKYLEVDREEDVLNCGVTIYRYDAEHSRLKLDCYNTVCYQQNPATDDTDRTDSH
jgi:2,3-bisphosphoglycerate-dependent phosphoglycerate mutase